MDFDKLKAKIRSDIEDIIRENINEELNSMSERIGSVSENYGEADEPVVKKDFNGGSVRVDVNVPVDNAPEFLVDIDKEIRHRYGNWSDMRID